MIILQYLFGWKKIVQIVQNINDSSEKILKISEATDKTLTYVTKVIGV